MSLNNPVIIVISGTYGVGKTSLAHVLSHKLDIRQHAGLGVISRTLGFIEKDNPIISNWGDYSNCKTDQEIINKLHDESKIAGGVISSIVEKAKITGAPYIIEGVQLLPDYLPMSDIVFIMLTLSDEDEHKKRFLTPNITKIKHLDRVTFSTVRIIDRELVKVARRNDLMVIDSKSSEDEIADEVIKNNNLHPGLISFPNIGC